MWWVCLWPEFTGNCEKSLINGILSCILITTFGYSKVIWASHGFDRGHAAEEASPTLMG